MKCRIITVIGRPNGAPKRAFVVVFFPKEIGQQIVKLIIVHLHIVVVAYFTKLKRAFFLD